jgi:hypothetical protein
VQYEPINPPKAIGRLSMVDRFILGMQYDNLKFFLDNPPKGLSEDTRLGLDAALMLLEQDVQAIERVAA